MSTLADVADETPALPKDESDETKNTESDSPFYISDGKVYKNENGQDSYICSELEIKAVTRDENSDNFGRLLEWKDPDGNVHSTAIPMEMLAGDGLDLRKQLLNGGLAICNHAARRHLLDYISSVVPTRALCVNRTGWHRGVFVLPDITIGKQGGEKTLLQSNIVDNKYKIKGSISGWRESVAAMCKGNSRLTFALSLSFAAPLLSLLEQPGIGFHFVGRSSEGKTTALRVAASVCGGDNYMNTWRSTANGLEGVAASHNDTPLILDEMGQASPKEAGEIVYMLANGQGKQRANKLGTARSKKEWRVMLISSGEISLAEHMGTAGLKAKAGQMVRLVDIPMDTGIHGGFEDLHGFTDGGIYADHLRELCNLNYGAVFREYIEYVTTKDINPGTVNKYLASFISRFVDDDASGQVKRVAGYFAIVAMGGVVAQEFTGISAEDCEAAAVKCFQAWLQNRGGTQNEEDRAALEQVRLFFQQHGESRFSHPNSKEEDRPTINRSGFKKVQNGEHIFLVFPEVFKTELCKGLNPQNAAKVCLKHGYLIPGSEGRSQQNHRVQGHQQKFYVFSSKALGVEDENEE